MITTKQLKRLPDNRGVITQILLGYKRHARDRGLMFELTYDEFAMLVQQPCHYCGCELSNLKTTKNCKEGFAYNGIDRVDNNVGYIIDNCRTSCYNCNQAKHQMIESSFYEWVENLYLNLKKKKFYET